MAGQEGATRDFGAQKSFPIDEFEEKLFNMLLNRDTIYIPFNNHRDFQTTILNCLDEMQYQVRFAQHRPHQILNPQEIIHSLRIVKSPAEIEVMAKAAEISAQAHIRWAMKMTVSHTFKMKKFCQIVILSLDVQQFLRIRKLHTKN